MGISTMFDQRFGDEIGSNSSKECTILRRINQVESIDI